MDQELPQCEPSASCSERAAAENRLMSSKKLSSDVMAAVESLRRLVNPPTKPTKIDVEQEEGAVDTQEEGDVIKNHSSTNEDEGDEDHAVNSEKDLVDDGWESGSVDDAGQVISTGIVPEHDHQETLSSGDDSSDDDSSIDSVPLRVTKNLEAFPKQQSSTPATSTFLPSLSVGFTRGDSDGSEFSDDDEAIDGTTARKNRRGQRARKAYVS